MTTLGELADVVMGQSPRGDEVTRDGRGLPLLNGPTEFGRQSPTPVQWTESPGKTAEKGDVLFCVRGSTTGRMNLADQRYRIGRGIAALHPMNPNDGRFLYYAVQGSLSEMLAGVTDSTFPNLSSPQIRRCELPDLPSQGRQRVGEVLGALDDKIAANQRVSEACTTMLTAYYETCDRTTGQLSELADFINGGAFTKDASGSGRMVVRIAEMKGGPGASTVYSDREVPEANTVRPGDVLFSWSGSLAVRRWFGPESIVNQHIFKVVPRDDLPAWVVYCALLSKLAQFQAIAADKATTMGHIQRHHLDTPVEVPTATGLAAVGEQAESLWDLWLAAEISTSKLVALRDALLPELMSGRLNVGD